LVERLLHPAICPRTRSLSAEYNHQFHRPFYRASKYWRSSNRCGVQRRLCRQPLGNLKVPLVPLIAVPTSEPHKLGLDLVSRFRITIDPYNKLVTFEPRHGFWRRWQGNVDIELAEQRGNCSVSRTSSARSAETGISLNDCVLSTDGEAVADKNATQANELLNGSAGTLA